MLSSKLCDCGTLESVAHNPEIPIVFAPQLNEYNLEYTVDYGDNGVNQPKARMRIYYCFFCGGLAPPSRRAECFTHVTDAEKYRIEQLTKGLKSLDEVIERFGEPDEVFEQGIGVATAGSEGHPPRFDCYRTLVYKTISETAEVNFVEFRPDQIHVSLIAKYIKSS